jgi:hypothetical protein
MRKRLTDVCVPRSSDRGALQQIVQSTNSKPTVAVWFKQDAVLALFLGIAMIFRQEGLSAFSSTKHTTLDILIADRDRLPETTDARLKYDSQPDQ